MWQPGPVTNPRSTGVIYREGCHDQTTLDRRRWCRGPVRVRRGSGLRRAMNDVIDQREAGAAEQAEIYESFEAELAEELNWPN